MADITLTAVTVSLADDPNPVIDTGSLAGATIAAGQVVYFDAATSTWKLANAVTSSATATARGIAINSAISGQPLDVIKKGVIVCSGLTQGLTYVLSGVTSGAIAPEADKVAATTWRNTIIGVAKATTKLIVNIFASDVIDN